MPHYYIVLDLEMNPVSKMFYATSNGLRMETVEIGALKLDADTNRIVDDFTCIVKPQFNHRIEPRITRLTGIRTKDILSARCFSDALSAFVSWVGADPVRVYSWSSSDYVQLQQECLSKHTGFPDILTDWIDFQAEYPKYLGSFSGRCFSLKDAAALIGAPFVSDCAHRALYDAQVTAKLVVYALSGEYRRSGYKVHDANDCARNKMTYSIGDACGDKLSALLSRMNSNSEGETVSHDREFARTVPAAVR